MADVQDDGVHIYIHIAALNNCLLPNYTKIYIIHHNGNAKAALVRYKILNAGFSCDILG